MVSFANMDVILDSTDYKLDLLVMFFFSLLKIKSIWYCTSLLPSSSYVPYVH